MRAEDLFQHLAEVLYVAIFVAVLVRALRRFSRARLDMVLFFGDAALVVILSTLTNLQAISGGATLQDIEAILLMALPYLLLRLVADFMVQPRWLLPAAGAGLLVSAIALAMLPEPLPGLPTALLLAYFIGISLYASIAFWVGARRARGVTRRRLQAVALGSVSLALDILAAGLSAALPSQQSLWGVVGPLFGMASGLAYVLGFAPPTWVRRAWQEPELRAFLERAAALPHLTDTHGILLELERGAASATGSAGASIGLLEDGGATLLFRTERQDVPPAIDDVSPDRFEHVANGWRLNTSARALAARVVRERRALFVDDLVSDDPANALLYSARGARAGLAAPIIGDGLPFGVLIAYAERAPIFADSDVELVQLLADQAAVILESRRLLDAAAQAQARAEATRLKEDFLSSAAHDLKTPITGILTQAQVIQRRLDPHNGDPQVGAGVSRIIVEARRLSALVLELLDVSLLEQGRLVSTRESVDLVELASLACASHSRGAVHCRLEAEHAVVAAVDPIRIRQLLDHLVDNAIQFSPAGSEVVMRIFPQGDSAGLEVRDAGIGIPRGEVEQVFERFHRASNVDDRRFAGLGLGLYLSRGIVEQHGGRIWATPNADGPGTTFSVSLPIAAPAVQPAAVNLSHGVLNGS
ncbi:MAG: GAF domain-containing protein [Chloroflexi bacterium]|nr:GAF domain-containing protein [Chloroflexota bacterium]